MELDLHAAAQALEKLLLSSTLNSNSLLTSRKTHKPSAPVKTWNKSYMGSMLRDDKEEWKTQVMKGQFQKNIEEQQYTQEVLVSPSKMKCQKQHTHRKPSIGFVPSPCHISCRIVEASGCGASAVLLGADMAGKRHGEKMWTNNLCQNPTPHAVIGSFPKNFLRKEVVSHVAATTKSQGTRVERARDIALSILFDFPAENFWRKEGVVERVVISCSNHPRTGYVSVLCVKEIKEPLVRIIIPGTLLGPFMKLTLFPKNASRLKVLRVGIIELAFAESWTDLCVVEEALTYQSDVEQTDRTEVAKSAVDVENGKEVEEHYLNELAFLSAERPIGGPQELFSAKITATTTISSVGMAQEDSESVPDLNAVRNKSSDLEPVTAVPAIAQTKGSKVNKKAYKYITEKQQLPIQKGTVEKPAVGAPDRVNNSTSGSSCDFIWSYNNKPPSVSGDVFFAHTFQKKVGDTGGGSIDLEQGPQLTTVSSKQCGSGEQKASVTAAAGPHMEHVSKALIAWAIKRRVLQNASIMRYLQENDNGHDFCNGAELEVHKQKEIKGMPDRASCGKAREPPDLTSTALAHHNWESLPHWSLRDALLETMKNFSAFCFTIARTSGEVLSSLCQPYGLHLLFLLSNEAQNQTPLTTDCFELMMMIACEERQRGRTAQPLFRMTDGFGCMLHSNRDVDAGRQWLLVFTLNDSVAVNDGLLESLRVYETISQRTNFFQRKKVEDHNTQLILTDELTGFSRPAALRSVLDFACLFETLLPALLPWLSVAYDMRYYGDVHPVLRPFIDDCGVVNLTSWFHCNLWGLVRSVVLSLRDACGHRRMNKSICEMPLVARRRLACLTLCKHVPLYAVWQPHIHATRVVLSNTHALHHIDVLDGILMGERDLETAAALLPDMSCKYELLDLSSTFVDEEQQSLGVDASVGAMAVSPMAGEKTSALAFQVLSVALRRSWAVVGLALPAKDFFDEDAFMDTVVQWAYAFPRVIVLFYNDHIGEEFSQHVSSEFLEAFAPVDSMKSALATACVDA